jgi:zinc protease
MNRIDRVALSDVNQTMRNTLKPEKFLIVTVGQDDPWQTEITHK